MPMRFTVRHMSGWTNSEMGSANGGIQMRAGNGYVDPDTLNEMRERTDWGGLLDE